MTGDQAAQEKRDDPATRDRPIRVSRDDAEGRAMRKDADPGAMRDDGDQHAMRDRPAPTHQGVPVSAADSPAASRLRLRDAATHAPRATMRLQLHKGFSFDDAVPLVPYMAELGISHAYVSPILTARAGSIHGYDVIDPTRVNPELGGEDGLRRLVAALRQAGLGLIVDIVPNHMAVDGADNRWWQDVLTHGQASRYAGFFDIDWNPPDASLRGKVLAPFLGRPYGEALAAGELVLDRSGDTPLLRYFDNTFPIDPRDGPEIAAAPADAYDPATERGRAWLHRLLERQHYRLAWWGAAGDEINWRRFFDINGLAGLRIEVPEVFEATHATLFRLYAEGLVDGVRVDHVDGLSDPPGYCRSLRTHLDALDATRPPDAPPGPAYLVVEKILGPGERLPADWGVDGTSGYDFMDGVTALLHDPAGEAPLSALWAEVTGRAPDFESEEIAARREILGRNFAGQLDATATALHHVARIDPATRDVTQPSIRRALLALVARFPVYRTYNAGERRSPGDDAAFRRALDAAKQDRPAADIIVLDCLDRWLGGEGSDAAGAAVRRAAATRFQQLTAPVAAKAVEDTAFYRYGRLLSRNDVGFDVACFGSGADVFHAACAERLATFPDAMLATATHDHKRGEFARARLAVLSEIPDAWAESVRGWMTQNARHRRDGAPSPGDEAMLYQMIVGAWPPDLDLDDTDGVQEYAERLATWFQKALREAKLFTDWVVPTQAYEDAARDFLFAVLCGDRAFRQSAAHVVRRIAPAGAVNGLAQMLLKTTAPGVPDTYQGTEFWDLSLVDPDNRRPVDWGARIAALHDIADPPALAASWRTGRVKQAVIARALALRRERPRLFARGNYVPLPARGPRADHVVAFARVHDSAASVTVVPRLPALLLGDGDDILIRAAAWEGTALAVPASLSGRRMRDVIGGAEVALAETTDIAGLLGSFPVALLAGG
jgi:malto-oligosyltrehalose synthase